MGSWSQKGAQVISDAPAHLTGDKTDLEIIRDLPKVVQRQTWGQFSVLLCDSSVPLPLPHHRMWPPPG